MADKSQPPMKKQKSEETPSREKSADEQSRRSSEPAVPTQTLQEGSIASAESVSPISTPSASFAEIQPNQSDTESWTTRGALGSQKSDLTDFSVASSAGESELSGSSACLGELPLDPVGVLRYKQKKGVEQAKSVEMSLESQAQKQEEPSTSRKDDDSDESGESEEK